VSSRTKGGFILDSFNYQGYFIYRTPGTRGLTPMESMIEAINNRISTRTYIDTSFDEEKKKIILNSLRSHRIGPFGNKMRFELLDFTELDRKEVKALGTYGMIKGAKLFIVGATILSEKAMEDFGYCLEKIILKVTSLGLGTCWLGGTFKRSRFARRIRVTGNEIVPGICPVGYARDRRALTDRLVRLIAKSNRRKEWGELFFKGSLETPLDRDQAETYAIPLESVRIGPSASNRQPWRIIREMEADTYHFYLRRTTGYGKIIREFQIQNIDMGIAMCNFELSAVEIGLVGQWEDRRPDLHVGDMEYIVSWVG
jgi:nitroreductase